MSQSCRHQPDDRPSHNAASVVNNGLARMQEYPMKATEADSRTADVARPWPSHRFFATLREGGWRCLNLCAFLGVFRFAQMPVPAAFRFAHSEKRPPARYGWPFDLAETSPKARRRRRKL